MRNYQLGSTGLLRYLLAWEKWLIGSGYQRSPRFITFHVSQLKKAIGDEQPVALLPPQLTTEAVLEVQPEIVLGTRVIPTSGQEEVLIQWKNLPAYESSCEWKKVIQVQFP